MTLTRNAEKVLLFIADHKGPGYPKVHEAAKELNLTELDVLRAIKELADAGFIEPARN